MIEQAEAEAILSELRALRETVADVLTQVSRKGDLLSLNQVEKLFKASRAEIRAAIKSGALPARSKKVQGGKYGYVVNRSDAARMFAVRGAN